MTLKEIIQLRLQQLGNQSPIELARKHGLKREFIDDILRGKKATVRTPGLLKIAAALQLDADALLRGELVPLGDKPGPQFTSEERQLIADYRSLPPDVQAAIRMLARADYPGNAQQEDGKPDEEPTSPSD